MLRRAQHDTLNNTTELSMPVSASSVSSLRSRTGVGILACKEALEEAQGDEEKAIELLRKRGIAQAAKKAARDQAEGLIFLQEGDGKAALLLLRCETDFVARDENFQALGKRLADILFAKGHNALESAAAAALPAIVQNTGENITLGETHVIEAPVLGCYLHTNGKIGVAVGLRSGTRELARDAAMHAAAMNPLYVRPEEAPADLLAQERDIWAAQLAKEGKPPQIQEKIMLGKERKFREEHALLSQPFAKDPTKTVGQHLLGAEVTVYIRLSVW